MLVLDDVTKRYDNGQLALDSLSLSVTPGEILAVVGGSGCGKSTLLRLIAGLEQVSHGRVVLDGQTIFGPRPEIGLVFQEPRLMAWLSVADNAGLGLLDLPAAERQGRVSDALARVGLTEAADRWPRELSGGMAQRVALARALVGRPQILLLDEPFSALDALTRADLQDHLLDLWDDDRPTLILVTHDIDEALTLADRVVVLRGNPGRIQTEVTPGLARPRERTGAEFQYWRARLLAELQRSFIPGRKGEEAFPASAI
jgi:sulfonate transport system ATP-binding protein